MTLKILEGKVKKNQGEKRDLAQALHWVPIYIINVFDEFCYLKYYLSEILKLVTANIAVRNISWKAFSTGGSKVRNIFMVLLFVSVFFQAVYALEDSDQLCIGCEAPTFSLPSLGEDYISLRDFCGEQLRKPWLNKTKYVVVLSFFATWCEPCKKEIPHLEKLQKEFSEQPVKFFLIDVGEERETVSDYVQKKKVELPVLLDRYKKTAEKFDALTLPRLFVLDKNGQIQRKQKGFTSADDFNIEMRELIKVLLQQN